MADSDLRPTPVDPSFSRPPRQPQSRGMLLGATAMLSGFVLFQAPLLYDEWKGLRDDWERSRVGQPLGFINISPDPSYAQPPKPWAVDKDDHVLLWAGWRDGVGHRWFRVGKSDLDLDLLQIPMGRDVVRAIDEPILEREGGQIWNRLQPDTPVVSFIGNGGQSIAYPVLLLRKVEAVNDTASGRPVLVVHTPFVDPEDAIDVFDPVVAGRRLTMGLSGHFQLPGPRPLLYDHQTESLWVIRNHQLTCVAGELRGNKLRRIQHGSPLAWSDWSSRYPGGQLVVGAVRPSQRTVALQ